MLMSSRRFSRDLSNPFILHCSTLTCILLCPSGVSIVSPHNCPIVIPDTMFHFSPSGDGSNTPSDDKYVDMMPEYRPCRDDLDDDVYNRYIGAEVLMDVPVEISRRAKVKHCVRNDNGTVVRTHYRDPLMDTREYKLECYNGSHNRYFANVISDNLYSHIDSEGRQFLVLEDIFRPYGGWHCSWGSRWVYSGT